ncbi:MAG: hypothetical protein HC794_10210 [Nitrospiraceae bacterium]|nr:hypothetical protein [Nitrospiraceae bacterium]
MTARKTEGGTSGSAVTGAGTKGGKKPVRVIENALQPGKTYRYKVIVCVLNPLYRQSRLPVEQVAENFHRISLGPDEQELADASWSAPIALDPAFLFFIVSANKDQKRIEAEVWTIYNGLWRRSSFIEYPGNVIGGLANIPGVDDGGLGIRMQVPSILLDIDSVSGAGVGGGGSAIRALFLDQTTGRIDSRLADQDRKSELRQRLINEEASQNATQVTQNN